MYIKASDTLCEIKPPSTGEKNLLLMSKTPIPEIESICGKPVITFDEEGNPIGEPLPIPGELLEVTYHFSTRTEKEAELEAVVAQKEAALAEQVRRTVSLQEELAEKESIANEAIQALRGTPVQGEDWDAAKLYRQGDTVRHGGVMYEAARLSKGKEPGKDACWVVMPEVAEKPVLDWESMETGTAIAIGDLVSLGDKTYRCIKAHAKSQVRIVTNTNFWEQVADIVQLKKS